MLPRTVAFRRQLRALVLSLHKWAGLSAGILFVVLGITGSLLTFYPEIDMFLHPAGASFAPGRAGGVERIVDLLQSAEPQRRGSWRIELPRSVSAPIVARYYTPEETAGRSFAPLLVTVDADSLSIARRRFWGDDFLTWTYDLHYTLLLGSDGKVLLGIAALVILLMCLSGLFLWWPSGGNWKGALSIKRHAAWKRLIYDLHAKPGVYGLIVALTLILTGLPLVVPHWFTPAISAVSPSAALIRIAECPAAAGRRVSADEALAIAQARFPDADARWIETPSEERGCWRIQLRQPSEPNQRFPRTNVWIDAQSGDILAVRDPRRNSAGDTLLDWLHPLHNGEALGLAGRIAVLVGGLLPLLAYVTGFVRWRQKPARTRRADGARRVS